MRLLRAILVAPSRYDEERVAIFRLGFSPNGALGALAGLAEDYNRRHAGRARIDYEFFDEHVRQAVTPRLLCSWRDAAAPSEPLVLMICGVQTATYPRARDIALMARREALEVIAGGVHLSAHGPSVDFLVSCGVHVAIGEVEPIWDTIIEDAMRGSLHPVYRITAEHGMPVKSAVSYMTAPDITATPFPHVPRSQRRRYVNPSQLFIDSSRGCPFVCTFCAVKNVFGRTVRSRDPARVSAWMMERVQQDDIRAFWFTDDNFVRNPQHMELLKRLAAGRSRGLRFSLKLCLDVESSCYAYDDSARGERTREFLGLCREAGVAHVYMGLESTNDAVLRGMRKGVNRDRREIHQTADVDDAAMSRRRLIERYRAAVRAWHEIGVSVECGYILGFSADGRGAGMQAARDFISIGVDHATVYLLAPLPGSEDYARAIHEGTLIRDDFNDYFTQRPLLSHPTLSPLEIEAELRMAVRTFWSWPAIGRRIARRMLGDRRQQVVRPWSYLKDQLGYKWMLSRGMYPYIEGLFSRRAASRPRREVVRDEDAARFYLRDGPVAASPALPAILADDSSMASLPVLSDHLLEKTSLHAGRAVAGACS
jgi:radical SAM superfamily enzyme YgiQ (UPF0313 family)